MKLTENQVTTIVYENVNKGETTSRVVIPTSVPKDVVRAIDVDVLTAAERTDLLEMLLEYREYTKVYMDGMFNFETWAEHAKNRKLQVNWRSFKVSGLKE